MKLLEHFITDLRSARAVIKIMKEQNPKLEYLPLTIDLLDKLWIEASRTEDTKWPLMPWVQDHTGRTWCTIEGVPLVLLSYANPPFKPWENIHPWPWGVSYNN